MTRTYNSTLREEQTRATRARIVDALVEQACENGRSDFSIAEVAARAGVAERTVYRHFPTREALLGAINDVVDDALLGRSPRSPGDVVGYIQELFGWFEQNARLVEAAHVSGLGGEVRAHGRRQRTARMRKLIEQSLEDLPEAERRRAFAVFASMFGSFTWRTMRLELGLGAKETVEAVEWVVRLVVADLAARRHVSTRARGEGRPARRKPGRATPKRGAR